MGSVHLFVGRLSIGPDLREIQVQLLYTAIGSRSVGMCTGRPSATGQKCYTKTTVRSIYTLQTSHWFAEMGSQWRLSPDFHIAARQQKKGRAEGGRELVMTPVHTHMSGLVNVPLSADECVPLPSVVLLI